MVAKLTLVIIFFLTITVVAAYECQDDMAYWNSPCEVVTPVLNIVGACNASILNINNTAMNQSVGISAIGDGTYNFTFNYTDIATYSITLSCNNYSGTVNLNMGTEEDEPGFNLWLILFVIFFILIIIGLYSRSYILLFISSGLPLLMGVYIFREGITIYGVGNWWIYPLAWIFTGLGVIIAIVSSIKFMAENEGEYEEGGGL